MYKLHLYETNPMNGNRTLVHVYTYTDARELGKDVTYFIDNEVVIHPYIVIEEAGIPGNDED